jgi:hypothetical protein
MDGMPALQEQMQAMSMDGRLWLHRQSKRMALLRRGFRAATIERRLSEASSGVVHA